MNTKRINKFISPRQARTISLAAEFAPLIGCPLNHAASISWGLAGGPGGGTWRDRQERLIALTRHWFTRRGCSFTHAWTLEGGDKGKDTHAHFAFHLPKAISENELRGYWLGLLKADESRVLDIRPMQTRVGRNGWAVGGRKGWLSYMLKGVEPRHYAAFGVIKKHQSLQGAVFGKRCGISQNIGPTARDRHQTT